MLKILIGSLASTWKPAGLALLILFGYLILEAIPAPVVLIEAFVVLFVISLCFLIAASIYQFWNNSWKKGLVSLFILLGVGAVSYLPLMFLVWFGHWNDPFGRYIVIPPDMVVETPLELRASPIVVANDADGLEFKKSLGTAPFDSTDTSVTVDLKILNRFSGANRMILLRHLATSAKWYVTEELGQICAYMRMVTKNGHWENQFGGNYTHSDFGSWRDKYFQTRTVLVLDDPVRHEPRQNATTVVSVGVGKIKLNIEKSLNYKNESYLAVRSDGPTLNIYEDSDILPRRITALALSRVEVELTELWQSEIARSRGFDLSLMPLESMKRDAPEIYVASESGNANYHVYAYANPGEAGRTYLKVFEATENNRLSEERIGRSSVEYMGWSDDPAEVFLYHSLITVFEGDNHIYYPARFELWFAPASGGPERKIIEKIFKVAGFER